MRLIEMEHKLFGAMALSRNMALSIFEFCPEFYSAIYDDQGIVAYSSAFPLKAEYASAFISGEISEPDIDLRMLVATKDGIERTNVYIGSVVVAERFDALTRSILLSSLLSWRITQMKHLCLSRLSVFMLSVSAQGDRMIRYVGAKKLNDGTNRRDCKSVYGRTITPGFLTRASSSLERCTNGRLVQMKFDNCHRVIA